MTENNLTPQIFQKKPETVQAVKLTATNLYDVAIWTDSRLTIENLGGGAAIVTLESLSSGQAVGCDIGWYITKHEDGTLVARTEAQMAELFDQS